MTRKVYRTAQGRMVDIGALQLKNENIRAVGNMSVNSRGDLLDADNRPIASRNTQVKRQYNRQVTNVSDQSVVNKTNPNATSPSRRAAAEIPAPPEDFNDDFVKDDTETPASGVAAPSGGLAGAIARAREVRQEPIKTARQQAQSGKINRV